MFSVQNSLAMFPIYSYGSEDQKSKWLPRMARGEALGCFALSEPGFGSDPAGMVTTAKREGKGFILQGSKMWISNGAVAGVAIVWAKTHDGIRAFLVEAGTPGFQASLIKRKFSYRTSPTSLLTFKDCLIPEENLLPGASGLKSVLQCLNYARFGVACGALGSAIACFRAARDFALERRVFEKPIASYQLVQEKLVQMMAEITKAQLLTYHLGRMMDRESGQAVPDFWPNGTTCVRPRISPAWPGTSSEPGALSPPSGSAISAPEAVSTLEGTERFTAHPGHPGFPLMNRQGCFSRNLWSLMRVGITAKEMSHGGAGNSRWAMEFLPPCG
jgi:alkylation response protein AidB-like acyl-CoA dehydrogenase